RVHHALSPTDTTFCVFLFSLTRPPPRSTLFPYTTLFRSAPVRERRPTSRDRVEVPVDGIAENEPAVAQEIEATLADGLGSGHDLDRKSTRLNSSHVAISYAVFCLKKNAPGPDVGPLTARV